MFAKNNVQDQNWRGWARGASKKFGTPYVFLQPLKLATSNLVQNLGLGLAYQKTTFKTKIGGGLGQGSIPKNWDPHLFMQPLKLATFKFATQLGLGTSLPKQDVQDRNWRGSGPWQHPKKFGTPYLFLQPLKLATSNLVHNLGLGLAYQQQRLGPKLSGVWARAATEKIGTPIYLCNC